MSYMAQDDYEAPTTLEVEYLAENGEKAPCIWGVGSGSGSGFRV